MNHVTGLRCVICGQRYQPTEVSYVCPQHGNEGILDVEYDYDLIRQQLESTPPTDSLHQRGMFAYRPFLPLQPHTPQLPLFIGATPVYDAPRLAAACHIAQVWVKDDGRNPTASFKDRASAIAVMKARELGAEIVTTASTGNAAAALAGCAASVGQKTVIFVPAAAPPAKIAQLLAYGATVLLVEGTYDDAFELCLEATDAFGWYCRNTAYNPYMAEGKKTVVYELYDQLETGDWRLEIGSVSSLQSPVSHIFVSVGDGCIISGVYKGLRDLVGIGRLPQMPQIMGVQAAGSAFLYDAWMNDEDVLTKRPIATNTLADSISAGLPRDRIKAMAAVRGSSGAFIKVSDEEILAAIPALAQGCGVFAEPAAAAAYAGLQKAARDGLLPPDARVALLITGNGLKDVGAAMKATGTAVTIPPKLSLVKKALAKIE
ncbi:MAG: threonine synthase [Ardenticatenaceae bacterium]|nr:threonine synthase [Ardenticatenaceae bacterium]